LDVLRILLEITSGRTRWPLIPLFVVGMLIALFDVAGVGLVFPLVMLIADPAAAANQAVLLHLGRFLGSGTLQPVILIFVIVAVFFAKNALQVVYHAGQARIIAATQEQLANRLVQGYLRAPYASHLQRNSAELIRNVSNLVRGAFGEAMSAVLGLGADVLAAAALIALLLIAAPLPSVAAGSMMVVLLYLQQRGFRHGFERLGHESAKLCHEELLSLQQSLGALKESQVLRREAFFEKEFAGIQRRLFHNARRFEFIKKLPPVVSEVAMMTVLLAAIAIMLARDDRNVLFAELGLLAAAAVRLMPLTNRIVMAMNMIHHARPGLQLLEQELAHGAKQVQRPRAVGHGVFTDRIALRDVSYRFAGGDRPVLSQVSLMIRRGEFIGLVGPSGAGKSTLADIILGVLQPDAGEIVVDGRVIGKSGGGALPLAGYVPQRITIFDDTLRRNVAFAVDNASIDNNRVEHALAQAQLLDFARALAEGLDTPLGEHGQRLSGGQRQRIGIARALYHSPDLLVLDEATSALDLQTEQDFNEAIEALRGRMTLIIIAHRLSTVRICDRLVLLDQGRVMDEGSFAELTARNARFLQLVELADPRTPPS
jgi:ABC-type multidrug transport system fused ATPase/permease subunit